MLGVVPTEMTDSFVRNEGEDVGNVLLPDTEGDTMLALEVEDAVDTTEADCCWRNMESSLVNRLTYFKMHNSASRLHCETSRH